MSRAEGEQVSSLNKGFIYYYGSLQICEQQSVFLLVSTHQKDERRKQTIFTECHFRRGFCRNNRQESKNKVSTSYKTVLSSKMFPKHDLVRSFCERSILAVRIGKLETLREPIRKLLFSADQFGHIIS